MCRTNSWKSWKQHIKSDDLRRKLKLETMEHYVSLRELRWAGHLARMPMTRIPRQLLTSWVSQPRPHGCPQYTYGHALNKTLKRGRIPSEFKEWSKLAQERSNWRKAMYPNAESLPSRQHLSANRKFYHPLACISHITRASRREMFRAPVVSVNPWFRCFPLFSRSSAAV